MRCKSLCYIIWQREWISIFMEKKENVISLGAMEEYYAHQTIEIGSV